MKIDKMPYASYADIESVIKKIDGCANNTAHFSTTKIGEHLPYGHSISGIWALDSIENKHILYHEDDCMKKKRKNIEKKCYR